MQIVVLNGTLSEMELDTYIKYITDKYPVSIIEKLILDVQGEYVDLHCTFHRFRDLRKMGGGCIGEPRDWNHAKQAELRDTIPNRIDL